MINPENVSNLAKMQQLLTEYNSKKEATIEAITEEKLKEFNDLIFSFKKVQNEGFLRRKQVADTFNIFRTLRIEYKETTLHSRLITDLLNPRGDHAQGPYFLERFFQSVDAVEFTKNCNLTEWITLDEVYAQQLGYIDILLYHPESPKRAIIIENKVYSGDQPLQLLRYYTHCRNMGFSDDEIQILYLTPRGRIPAQHSTCDKVLGDIGDKVKPISYGKHINDWLDHSLNSELPLNLKITLQHYTQIIKNL